MNDFNFSADGLRLLKTTHWIFMPTAKHDASPLDIVSNKTKTRSKINIIKITRMFSVCVGWIYTWSSKNKFS